jgi:hypothetical protein
MINVNPNNVTKDNQTTFFLLLGYKPEFFKLFYTKYGIDNLNHQTNKGNDILMASINLKKDEIIKYLLLENNLDFNLNLENKDGYNVISIAFKNSNFKILDLFKTYLQEKKKFTENQINEIIENSKQKILFNDYNKNATKTIPSNFEEYIKYIENENLNVDYEPCIISQPDCEVYIIGDLEGDYNVFYHWLRSKNFITEDLKWIADKKVYIIQCGDQLDNGRSSSHGYMKDGKPQYLPRLSFFNRKNIDKYKYYTHDIFLMLFLDYLSIISKNHVLSILGNHVIMNTQIYFRYVKDRNRVV